MRKNLEEISELEFEASLDESPGHRRGSLKKIYARYNNLKSKLKENLYEYFVTSGAIVTIGNPVWAVLETQVMGMTPQVSFNQKINGTIACFSGMAYASSKIRDFYHKIVGINENSSEKKILLHDSIVGAINSIIFGVPLYLLSGETDPNKLMYSVGISALLNCPMGILNGYSIDFAKNLFGIEKSKRVPRFISDKPGFIKKNIGYALAAGSMAVSYCYLKSLGL